MSRTATKESVLFILENRKDRSAWSKGVTTYAFMLLENVDDEVLSLDTLRSVLLNGAKDWREYSYSGNALIYDGDIAETLCTKSELNRTRGGELNPSSRETWLDVQARALRQAFARVSNSIISIGLN